MTELLREELTITGKKLILLVTCDSKALTETHNNIVAWSPKAKKALFMGFLKQHFPEVSDIPSENEKIDSFNVGALQKFVPHLVKIVKNIVSHHFSELFKKSRFPLTLEFRLENSSHLDPQTTRLNHSVISINYASLIKDYVLDKYSNDKHKRNLLQQYFNSDSIIWSHYLKTDLSKTTLHELRHFMDFCHHDRRSLVFGEDYTGSMITRDEIITTFREMRDKPVLFYPNHGGMEVAILNDIHHIMAIYLGFFIGLAMLKKGHPYEFDELYIYTKDKEKVGLKWVDFEEQMLDKNRPFYFKNLPPEIYDLVAKKCLKWHYTDVIDKYLESAKILGVPKRNLLVDYHDGKRPRKNLIEWLLNKDISTRATTTQVFFYELLDEPKTLASESDEGEYLPSNQIPGDTISRLRTYPFFELALKKGDVELLQKNIDAFSKSGEVSISPQERDTIEEYISNREGIVTRIRKEVNALRSQFKLSSVKGVKDCLLSICKDLSIMSPFERELKHSDYHGALDDVKSELVLLDKTRYPPRMLSRLKQIFNQSI